MPGSSESICIYCGNPAKKVRDGEHIIQQAIGGSYHHRNIWSAGLQSL